MYDRAKFWKETNFKYSLYLVKYSSQSVVLIRNTAASYKIEIKQHVINIC